MVSLSLQTVSNVTLFSLKYANTTIVRSLYRHVVYNGPVSSKANVGGVPIQ